MRALKMIYVFCVRADSVVALGDDGNENMIFLRCRRQAT